MLKKILIAGALFLASAGLFPLYASAYDFTLSAKGPNRVVQGYDLHIQLFSAVTAGTTDYAYYYVDNLPAGASVYWVTINETECCTGNRGWGPMDSVLRISVPTTVPVGTYNITIREVSGGVTHTTPYTMIVDPVPAPLATQPVTSVPPIPDLALWESNMKSYGATYCNLNNILANSTSETGVWYYDGMRVYFQIADYTKDPSWNTCAGYVEQFYKPWVLNNTVQGWRTFPHGLSMDWFRNASSTSKDAAIKLGTAYGSAFAVYGGGVLGGITQDNGLERETAYLISDYRIAKMLGMTTVNTPRRNVPVDEMNTRAVDYSLGIIDQQFISNTAIYMKPFFMGLTMESLIQYYEVTKDPRIPSIIKTVADGLWARAWLPASKSFYYESTDPYATADLNLLIAPAYAWLYKVTGNPVYQQEGDQIFQGGVEGAWLGNGKQFSQNYRWSFDYVNWRMHPDTLTGGDTTAPSVPTGLSATAISSSQINLAWTASTDNVGVTGYKIFRNGTQVGTSATNSYSDTGLSASTLYPYTVSAYDAANNNSAQSGSVSATTQSSVSTYSITVTQGANGTITPGTTSVTSGSNQTFTITPNSGYQIASVTVDGTNQGSISTYTFTNVTAAHTITASFTATTDTQAPSVPTGLSATAISSSQINLAWTASTDNVAVTGYKIFRGGVQVGTSATNSYSDSGLTASTLYSYTVSAYDAAGNNSAQSTPPASATTGSGTGTSQTLTIAATTPSTSYGLGRGSSYTSLSQSFVAPAGTLTNIQVGLRKSGNPSYPIAFALKNGLTGTTLYSATITSSQVTSTTNSNPTWVSIAIPSSVVLTAGNTYYLNLSVTSTDSGNYYRWPVTSGNPYTGGMFYWGTSAQTGYDAFAKITYLSQVAMLAAPSSAPVFLARQLEVGSTGEDVSLLQTFLASHDHVYPEKIVSGYYGNMTASAVSAFQGANGLPSVGRVGPMTLQKLNELLENFLH